MRVRGWAIVTWRLAVVQWFCRKTLMLAGLMLLVLGVLPALVPPERFIPEGGVPYRILMTLFLMRRDGGEYIREQLPVIADLLRINPYATYSWKLVVAGFLVMMGRRVGAHAAAWCIGVILPPLVRHPFRALVRPEFVRIWRWGIPWTYSREAGVPVQFMTHQVYRASWTGKSIERLRVVMRYGYRLIVIADRLNERDASRIAAALNYARDYVDRHTDGVSGGPDLVGMYMYP